MLTYDFRHIEGPIYEYIYKCIKEDILAGNILPGEELLQTIMVLVPLRYKMRMTS